MSKRREYRKAEIRTRVSADGKPGVTLKVIAPGVVDDYGSVWEPTVFDASIDKRMPVLCWSHDWSEPLGPATEVRWPADGDGTPVIDFDFSDFDAVPMAKRAHAQVLDGTIRDCSVGFSSVERRTPTDEERVKWPGVREVMLSATLDEVSLVLAGAVPGASVASVRSAGGGSVAIDAVVELAKRVATGELTNAEAKAAIDLLTDVSDDANGDDGAAAAAATASADAEAAVVAAAELDASADAALALVGRSR